MFKKLVLVATSVFLLSVSVYAQDWMPDENLREIVAERLEVETLTIRDMRDLTDLVSVERSEIANLEGLQYAVNLEFLHIGRALISDVSVLENLKNLHTLKLHDNEIVDINALSSLTNLEELVLTNNQIQDVNALENLTNLKTLVLTNNQIVDVHALSNLANLKVLILDYNQIRVFTPLLGLTQLEYLRTDNNYAPFYNIEEFCEFLSPNYVRSVANRIENRNYPSTFRSHIGMGNRDDLNPLERLSLWDLAFGDNPFQVDGHYLTFYNSKDGMTRYRGDSLNELREIHRAALDANPNMLFLVEITYFDGRHFNIPLDSPYWLRHPDGTIAHRELGPDIYGNVFWEPLLDFSHPEVQEMIIGQAVAVAQCGLYDGIWLDRWPLGTDFGGELSGLMSEDAEDEARDRILHGIRESVREDFLIIINAPWQEIPRWAPFINGVFLETWPEGGDYDHQDFRDYEKAIAWYEENLREPNFTLLRGELITHDDPQSDINQQVMRSFTTLSLTHSDGYVTMSTGYPQYTYWYDFWETQLGYPIDAKSQTYNGIDGLFIREFAHGWAVYNRSGSEQEIEFESHVSGKASEFGGTKHIIRDLDGEIYLKRNKIDLNADGTIDILDLVIVANAFGEIGSHADVNGDGVVNILDLVFISINF